MAPRLLLGSARRGRGMRLGIPGRARGNALPQRKWRSEDTALTAAGFRIKQAEGDQMRRLIAPWQLRAFNYYDQLGEIKYASQFYSRMLQPLRLFVGVKDPRTGEVEEVDNDANVTGHLDRIQDPGGGRTGLLGAYGRLMFLAGEGLLFVTKDKDTGIEQWEMLSTDELRVTRSGYTRFRAPSLAAEQYHEADDDELEPITDDTAVAYRIWKRHPRYSWLADSTMMGVLDICEELLLLTYAIRARARSRLAGSGILLLPEGIGPAPLEPVGDEDPLEDPFLDDLVAHMTTPIQEEGAAAAVVPIIVRGNAEQLKEVRHVPLVDPMQLYPETGLRRELIDRLAIGLDMPPEILTGTGDANHWCADAETEILTGQGWKRHEELAEWDEVLTLNHESGLSEWQPVQQVARFDVSDLPMLSVESRFHSSLTTLNHRWPILKLTGRERRWERGWVHSDELRTTHRIVGAAASSDNLRPQWVQHDDALVELVAWLWTEGQIRRRPGRKTPQVAIYQSHKANPENVLRIRSALTALYGAAVLAPMQPDRRSTEWAPARWREIPRGDMTIFSLNRAAAARLLEHVSDDRIVATNFVRTLTAAQLNLFIDASLRADGSRMRSGTGILGQADPARLFPLELAVILSGRSPATSKRTHQGFRLHEQHWVSISDRQTVRIKRRYLRTVSYTGTIWCPVTENSTWLARRNGKVYFTGNTVWNIDEQTWKAHGQPVAQQFCDDLTGPYLLPALRQAGVANWQQYVVAYDASKVINHPDRGKDALDLYGKAAIGKAALREAKGFDEKDAPTEEERAEIIGILVRDPSLAWYGIPSTRTAIEPAPGELVSAQGNAISGPVGDEAAAVEKGPPASGPPSDADEPPPAADLTSSANGRRLSADSRLMGAVDLAVLRARELAGARLRGYAKRDPEALAMIDGVHNTKVASTLGMDRVRALGVSSDVVLVDGAGDLIADSLHLFGIKDSQVADLIAEKVEEHAARTLYEDRPGPLSPSLQSYVAGLLSAAAGGRP